MNPRSLWAWFAPLMGLFLPTNAFAHFDPQGNYTFDPRAVHTESFESLPSWNPAQPDPNAIKNLFTLNDPGALEGNRVGAVSSLPFSRLIAFDFGFDPVGSQPPSSWMMPRTRCNAPWRIYRQPVDAPAMVGWRWQVRR